MTLPQLTVLKSQSGSKVQIIERAQHKWKDIAGLICSNSNKISTLENEGKSSKDCLRQVLVEDFIENKPQNYSNDWKGLIKLLNDVDLTTLADEVKEFFSS